MIERQEIESAVFAAIAEVNEQLPENGRIEQSSDARLFGQRGVLDSLGLVNLIVAVEQEIEDAFDETVTLADEKAVSQKNSPFKSVESLVDYIADLLNGDDA